MDHVESYRLQDRATGLWVVWSPQGHLLAPDTAGGAMRCFVGAATRAAAEAMLPGVFREPRLAGRDLVAAAVTVLSLAWCRRVKRGFAGQ